MIDQNDNGQCQLELCRGSGASASGEPVAVLASRDGPGEAHGGLREMLLLFHADFALFPRAGDCGCPIGDDC